MSLSFSALLDKRMAKVNAINREPVSNIKWQLQQQLYSWMDGLRDAGVNTGCLILESDLWQIEHGNDGPMCGGIFNEDHPKYISSATEATEETPLRGTND